MRIYAITAIVSMLLLAGCATTTPFLVDGNPVVCPFCGTRAVTENLYDGASMTQLDTTCAFCPRCKIGIDTPGMLDQAEAELYRKGLR